MAYCDWFDLKLNPLVSLTECNGDTNSIFIDNKGTIFDTK
jgi:hypothetical protein